MDRPAFPPFSGGADLGWPAIDVTSMKALVRLAEVSGQLILHSHDELTDTYMVNDEGSVYRYQVKLPKVVWGEWTEPSATTVSTTTVASAAAMTAAATAMTTVVNPPATTSAVPVVPPPQFPAHNGNSATPSS